MIATAIAFWTVYGSLITPIASAGLTAFMAWIKRKYDLSEKGTFMKKENCITDKTKINNN